MAEKKLVVMISSTARDLPEYRDKAMRGCLRAGMFPDMMEQLPASDEDAIPGIHRRIGCSDSEATTDSEAKRNGEGAPRILSGCGVRAPGDRESDQESRPHQFGHDVLLGRSCSDPLHRPCHPTSTVGSSYFSGQRATLAGITRAGLSSHGDGHKPIT